MVLCKKGLINENNVVRNDDYAACFELDYPDVINTVLGR